MTDILCLVTSTAGEACPRLTESGRISTRILEEDSLHPGKTSMLYEMYDPKKPKLSGPYALPQKCSPSTSAQIYIYSSALLESSAEAKAKRLNLAGILVSSFPHAQAT